MRAAFTAGKDERFELDIRISRQQMADLQPRMVEANRIAEEFGIRHLPFAVEGEVVVFVVFFPLQKNSVYSLKFEQNQL